MKYILGIYLIYLRCEQTNLVQINIYLLKYCDLYNVSLQWLFTSIICLSNKNYYI